LRDSKRIADPKAPLDARVGGEKGVHIAFLYSITEIGMRTSPGKEQSNPAHGSSGITFI
jgi:hypothetical protein